MLSALLLAAAWPAGDYRLTGEPDAASELRLNADGSFAYALSAGALDEHAEGRWTTDGATVWLTTEPKPRSPVFRLSKETRASGPLQLKVAWPDGRGIAGVDLTVGFSSGEPVEGYTQEDGWTLEDSEGRTARWVQFAVPMHGLQSPRFPIDSDRANELTFTLEPNDLGIPGFERLPLKRSDDGLIMVRDWGELHYREEHE